LISSSALLARSAEVQPCTVNTISLSSPFSTDLLLSVLISGTTFPG
jgi:hypothetical protein